MGSSSSWRMMLSRRDSTQLNTPTPDETSQPNVDLSSGVPRSRSSMLQRNESQAIHGRYDNAHGIDDEMGVEEGEEMDGEMTAEEEEEGGGGGTKGGEEQPVRVSLMALWAEMDRQMGLDGSGFTMDDDKDAEEEEEEGGAGGGGYNNCCVCMVGHKGAAFIPCDHMFCRLCSRELWVQRRNCPLYNNFILEILDIF